MTRTVLYRRLLVVLLLWLAGALRLHQSLQLGTQTDEGIHITAAEQIASNGKTLYIDLFENRTPGVHWLLASVFEITGPSLFVGRLLSTGMAMLTVAALFVAVTQTAPSEPPPTRLWAGLLAGSLFALAPLPLSWARYTMLEHFAAAAAAGSVACLLYGMNHNAPAATLSSGLLAGLAVFFKQTELTLIAASGLVLLGLIVAGNLPGSRRRLIIWSAGVLLTGILFLSILALQDALPTFFAMLSGAERVEPFANLGQKTTNLWHWAIRRPHSLLAIFAFVVVLWRRSAHVLLIAFWTLASAGFLFLPAELDLAPGGFSHYLIVPLVATSALIGAASATGFSAFRSRYTKLAASVLLVSALFTVPGWIQDLSNAIREAEYPQPNFEAEKQISRAAALLTSDEEPILVLSNAVFYHWAQRAPASRYFHFPEYFATSATGERAADELAELLSKRQAGAVLISRMHLQERLPQSVQDALWKEWTPVTLFPYPYQRDVILFLPRETLSEGPPVARFDAGIDLIGLENRRLAPDIYLLKLVWQAEHPPEQEFTVFAHILDEQGQLVAQSDSVPVAGFRPTTSWRAGERVVDYHWIELPFKVDQHNLSISTGLYLPQSGERVPLQAVHSDLSSENDAIKLPLVR